MAPPATLRHDGDSPRRIASAHPPPLYYHSSDLDHRHRHSHASISSSSSAQPNDSFIATSSNALPPSIQRPMNQLVPEQQLQLTNIHRFTPSCSRCRAKKLKCDTNLPCNQCVSKGIHDDCRKDPRIPRGRKRPKPEAHTSNNSPDPQVDEIAKLKKRIRELESLMANTSSEQQSSQRTSHSRSPTLSGSAKLSGKASGSSHQLGTSSRGSHTTGLSEAGRRSGSQGRLSPTPSSSFSDDEEIDEAERTLLTLEKLAASDPRVGEPGHGRSITKQINNVRPTQIPLDGPHLYFNRPSAQKERIEMLLLAKQLTPEKMVTDELVYAFNLRCHNLVGHIIHIPSFLKDAELFSSASLEEIVTSDLDMYDLARYLMVLRLGMRFYPWKGGIFVDDSTPEFIAINALKNRKDDISRKWRDLAKRALAADQVFSLASFKAIQAALLMILDGRDSPTYLRMLLRISIQTALDMGLHRLGNAMPSSKNPDEDIVRLETGVRIWWYLVVKDWCSAQREGAYTVHPSQMTTRRPLHTNDVRLSEGQTDEIPTEKYCEMSYTLCQIQLAHIIRESIDLRNEQSTLGGSYDVISPTNKKLLQGKLESFLSEDLPPFYRLESTEMRPGVLAVQRCLLHQQTFDVLLKLNRKSLASYSERSTCALLAEQIVSTQKLLRSVCPVIDGFWVNFLHLFGATLTLVISLLLDEGLDIETRNRRRGKVHAALVTMRETPGSDRGSRIIETLLQEEERCWVQEQHQAKGTKSPPTSASRRDRVDLSLITRRIVAQTGDLDPIRSGPSTVLPASATRSLLDVTPDESVVPAFASSWGGEERLDRTTSPHAPEESGFASTLQNSQNAKASESYTGIPRQRPYEYSLRPWQEPAPPPPSVAETASAHHSTQNNFWDWALSQGALHHGPPPPQPQPGSGFP